MGNSKKTVTVVSVAIIFAIGLGIAIGATIKSKGNINDNNNAVPVPGGDASLNNLSVEELSAKLSLFMLPEDEFSKLGGAIYQTALGLLGTQARQAGVEISESMQQELKKSIDEKYSRKYFADINANSMKELSKPDLISILNFYNTDAGQKFLKMSPKIIQTTMSVVQADLTQWLPKTVDALVAKIKGGNNDSTAPSEGKDGVDSPKAPEIEQADG